jgi:hypothetical protein
MPCATATTAAAMSSLLPHSLSAPTRKALRKAALGLLYRRPTRNVPMRAARAATLTW